MCVSVAISVISSISEESPSNNDHKYVPLGYHRGTVLTCLTFSVSSLIIPHVHHWGTVLACLTFIVSSLIVPHVHHWGTVLACLTFTVSSLIVPHVHHWGTVLTCLTFIVSSLIILSTNTSEGIQQLMLHAHGSPAAMNSSQFQPH